MNTNLHKNLERHGRLEIQWRNHKRVDNHRTEQGVTQKRNHLVANTPHWTRTQWTDRTWYPQVHAPGLTASKRKSLLWSKSRNFHAMSFTYRRKRGVLMQKWAKRRFNECRPYPLLRNVLARFTAATIKSFRLEQIELNRWSCPVNTFQAIDNGILLRASGYLTIGNGNEALLS